MIGYSQALLRDLVPVSLMILLFIFSIFVMDQDLDASNIMQIFSILLPMIIIGSLSILWSIIEIISMLFNEKSRVIHDIITKTVVIRTN